MKETYSNVSIIYEKNNMSTVCVCVPFITFIFLTNYKLDYEDDINNHQKWKSTNCYKAA